MRSSDAATPSRPCQCDTVLRTSEACPIVSPPANAAVRRPGRHPMLPTPHGGYRGGRKDRYRQDAENAAGARHPRSGAVLHPADRDAVAARVHPDDRGELLAPRPGGRLRMRRLHLLLAADAVCVSLTARHAPAVARTAHRPGRVRGQPLFSVGGIGGFVVTYKASPSAASRVPSPSSPSPRQFFNIVLWTIFFIAIFYHRPGRRFHAQHHLRDHLHRPHPRRPDYLIHCTHPPFFAAGRGGRPR